MVREQRWAPAAAGLTSRLTRNVTIAEEVISGVKQIEGKERKLPYSKRTLLVRRSLVVIRLSATCCKDI